MTDFTKDNVPAGVLKEELTAKMPGTRDEPIPPPETRRTDGTKDRMPVVSPFETDQFRKYRTKKVST